jgi:outer membrane biosynthesis protein TonB
MRKSDRIYAIIATVLFHLLLLLGLLWSFLRFPPEGVEWPPADHQEIVIDEMEELYAAGDFVRTGDNLNEFLPQDAPAPSDQTNPEPTQDAVDDANAGVAAVPAQMVTSKKNSAMKVEETAKGPTKEELEAEKARQEAKKQQETKKNVDAATSRAFGGGKGKSTSGSVEGNSTASGAVTGNPGSGVKGRSLEKWSTVRGTKLGTITINVKVNAQGKVTDATYNAARSSGTVSADASMRSQCIARSLECRFSVAEDAPLASGTITWIFK